MKTCANCFWADRCCEAGTRCEYYEPLVGFEHIAEKEYRQDLKERDEVYKELIREQQGLED